MPALLDRLPYRAVTFLIGLPLAWVPWLLHGPIHQKLDVLHINGVVAVWGWYSARMLIGYWVGASRWPIRWWVRGPLCGFLVMFPLTVVSLATPGCGSPCMGWNLLTGSAVGFTVAGLARIVTGKDGDW